MNADAAELRRLERLIIILRHYEEMTWREIAATLDISEEAAQLIHERLQKRLEDPRTRYPK